MKKIAIDIYTHKNFVVDKNKLKNMIRQMAKKAGKEFSSIELSFLPDEELFEINKKFLNHATYTDIITFTYDINNALMTEILISYERAFENSKKYRCTFEDEILRLIAHGLLHSIGFEDKTKTQKLKMRKAENDLLKSINKSEFIKKFEMEKVN